SVMSFDDADWAEVVNPSLTTIGQPTYEMGTAAVDLLLRSIGPSAEHAELKPQQILLKSTLRVRGSTGPVPKN
ncbi:MAG: substrate-binding domain-containing protein, partial [Acidobacteriaceae bacterium]